MILQNNEELLPVIKRLGCYYLSLSRMIEMITSYSFTANELNSIWLDSKTSKYINYRNEIVEPDKILRSFCKRANKPNLIVAQVGEMKENKVVFWNWYKENTYDYMIEMLLTTGVIGTHFVLDDKSKGRLFDSYSFKEYLSTPSGRFLLYKVLKDE